MDPTLNEKDERGGCSCTVDRLDCCIFVEHSQMERAFLIEGTARVKGEVQWVKRGGCGKHHPDCRLLRYLPRDYATCY